MDLIFYVFSLAVFAAKSVSHSDPRLRSDQFKELGCPKEPIPLFSGRVNYVWLGAPSAWYIPMASQRTYRLSAEILLGRPARSLAELDLIDLRVRGFLSYYKITGFSGSKSFTKSCFPTSHGFPKNTLSNTCLSLWGTPGSNIEPAAKATDNIVWTDNENAVLIVPCNEKANSLDWFVLTKRTTISDTTKASILNEIKKFGFNPANAAYYDYENQHFVNRAPKILKSESPSLATILTYPTQTPAIYYSQPQFPLITSYF